MPDRRSNELEERGEQWFAQQAEYAIGAVSLFLACEAEDPTILRDEDDD